MDINAPLIMMVLFTITANVALAMLFFWIKRTESRIMEIEGQLGSIRLNYLDRFDDIKSEMANNHLEVIQKIVKLDTYLFKIKN